MSSDLARDWRLEELATLVDLTPRHLTSLFRQRFNQPPHSWLVLRRIEQARTLLSNSDRDVTDIALACGFSSAQHFATVFRKRSGETPSGYRLASRC
jgi:AraC family transcriptional regulator